MSLIMGDDLCLDVMIPMIALAFSGAREGWLSARKGLSEYKGAFLCTQYLVEEMRASRRRQ